MGGSKGNNIGEARRRYAKASGEKFRQEDAAKCFGVSRGTYSAYEQGDKLRVGVAFVN